MLSGWEAHVARDPYPVAEVLDALPELHAPLLRDSFGIERRQRTAQEAEGRHPEQHVGILPVPRLRKREGVGQGRAVSELASVPVRPTHELDDALVVPGDLERRLMPGRLLAHLEGLPDRLPAVWASVRDRDLPARALHPLAGYRLLPVVAEGVRRVLGVVPAPAANEVHRLAGLRVLQVDERLPVLRRDVHHVRVEVALRRSVGLPPLEGLQPPVQVRPPRAPHLDPLPVHDRSLHALDVGDELQVDEGRVLCPEEERAPRPSVRLPQRLVEAVQEGLVPLPALVPLTAEEALQRVRDQRRRVEQVLAPGAEQGPLEPVQLLGLGRLPAGDHVRLEVRELGVEELHDRDRVRVQPPVELHGRKEAVRHLVQEPLGLRAVAPHVDVVQEPLGLWAVAPHVDVCDLIGDALLLEHDPDLLAVRAPRRPVPVQRDPHIRLRVAEEAERRVRVGPALAFFPGLQLLDHPLASWGRVRLGDQRLPAGQAPCRRGC
eukprot:CAMPEP_0114521902 /NCGR_PEP_ID=MMETSP0109-20121206/20452_1 /TAXON_ID=29199 /ORGANISM="Chlorarachnion reptans, Strain CCCM449" /LENGTH=490 /DNA_ID=CAMNT_0001703075 /DNA_START=381 /DNA_END=1850 /DNA_ORIENTATION=-